MGGVGSEGSGADPAVGTVICGRQVLPLTMHPFSDIRGVLTPGQAEEEEVRENLLPYTSRIEREKEIHVL